MFLNSFPQLRAVLLTQKHDRLPRARPQIVGLLDALNEQVVEVLAVVVELHQLLGRIV